MAPKACLHKPLPELQTAQYSVKQTDFPVPPCST